MSDFEKVYSHYQTFFPRRKPKDADRKAFARCEKNGYSSEEMIQSIDGMMIHHENADWYAGENERERKFNRFDIALRDTNIDEFIEATIKAEKQSKARASRIEKEKKEQSKKTNFIGDVKLRKGYLEALRKN